MAKTKDDRHATCIRLGICTICRHEKAEEGYTTCLSCRIQRRKQENNEYAVCVKLGICTVCKREMSDEGHTTCLVCRMRRREHQNSRRALIAGKVNKQCSEIYYKHKANHECVCCGEPLPEDWKLVRCEKCHNKLTRRDRKRWERKKVEQQATTEYRRENGLCYRCGKPVLPGFRLCEEHYNTNCKNLATAWTRVDKENHPWRKQNALVHFLGSDYRNNSRRTGNGISDSPCDNPRTEETTETTGEEH